MEATETEPFLRQKGRQWGPLLRVIWQVFHCTFLMGPTASSSVMSSGSLSPSCLGESRLQDLAKACGLLMASIQSPGASALMPLPIDLVLGTLEGGWEGY